MNYNKLFFIVRWSELESEADIENHLSNLDSHFRPAPRATQVMVESLPLSMRKQYAAGGGGLGPQPTGRRSSAFPAAGIGSKEQGRI